MSMPEPHPQTPVRRQRRTQSERREETRGRILSAAAKLILQRGYAGLRTAEVATVAGVSRGAQLHHFPTKQELVVATLRHVFDEVRDVSRSRARSVSGDVFERIIEDAREFFFSHHFLIAVDIVLSASTDPAIRTQVLDLSREARLPVEEAWREALVEAGLPEAIAGQLLALTLHIVRGAVIRRLWDDNPRQLEALFGMWREMIRLYLAAHVPTAKLPQSA
jgi:AcrR family transcriptional regulator